MLKLVVLGALGYLGYKYLGSKRTDKSFGRESVVAGGPLSANAVLQSNSDLPPADPFGGLTPASNSA